MTLSRRLTRAGLAFVLFGTAALLPSQDTSALAANGCSSNTQNILQLGAVTGGSTFTPITGGALTLSHTGSFSLGARVSTDGGTTFTTATTGAGSHFPNGKLTFTVSNTGASGTFYVGPTSASNPTGPGASSSYSSSIGSSTTGLFASKAGMTGSVSVTFQYTPSGAGGPVTLVQTVALSST